ncbi:MAG TPA: hypothetical protein VG944_03920 [Fimbriimonas sp.]|nr:hypothetical protein [Fimbriimonas sp.]
MKRISSLRGWGLLCSLFGCAVGVLVILDAGMNFLLTGSLWPLSHVDRLTNPVQVSGWTEGGLRLADGRIVMPLGMIRLPETSAVLQTLTEHGVQVDSDGRTYGLVRIWHSCGNDPVRYDLSKIDLAQLLAFEREGKSTLKPDLHARASFEKMGGSSSHGWSISDFILMKLVYRGAFAGYSDIPRKS